MQDFSGIMQRLLRNNSHIKTDGNKKHAQGGFPQKSKNRYGHYFPAGTTGIRDT